MKRRGFLGLLMAAIAAPFVPKPALPSVGVPFFIDELHEHQAPLAWRKANPNFTVVIRCDESTVPGARAPRERRPRAGDPTDLDVPEVPMSPRLDTPGLPPPLVDDQIDTPDRVIESSWDTLATTAIECCYPTARYFHRVRVTWLRFALVHWCCWRRMRIGAVDTQPKDRTFGWERNLGKFAACQACGRIKGHIF